MEQRRPQTRRPGQLNHDPVALRWVISQSKFTQKELAEKVGLHPSTLSLIVSGQRNCTPANLANIAKALQCPKSAISAKVRSADEAAA
ncbi:helix-turn-helix domain-containing protein [Modestobacter sp. VKM Ac-2985]|uniref:helix-turn-helix domain-containing protein n=1 Tax=Modestobacter sp. VKM Ac-2985 TaxID=3004139 RepID=UPI0022AB5D0C|nr:helix-turn-helix transcriptional regulator [Modestobacter sp. VKM Ac-2985]MCZ2837180.1 helix-turn-helix transcriptional regulator [Modestobacter sp. VKM Ac-2985]